MAIGSIKESDLENALFIRMYIKTAESNKPYETLALIDSGCDRTVISDKLVRELQLDTKPKQKPMMVLNADGSANVGGLVWQDAVVTWKLDTLEWRTDNFTITSIGKLEVILGFDWLASVSPIID